MLSIGKCFLTQILVKPAQKVIFSRYKQAQIHSSINLNKIQIEIMPYQKHLRIILDEQVNFKQHIDSAISKINKISVI